MDTKEKRIFWTDGSASPNPGPGGFAVLEVFEGDRREEILERFSGNARITEDGKNAAPVRLGKGKNTTNIRMEGEALYAAISCAENSSGEIFTDSEFWINVLTKWAPSWEKNGWKKKNGEIKNLDLVKKLYEIYSSHDIKLNWVKGHDGIFMNEMADEFANRARKESGVLSGGGTEQIVIQEL